MLSATDPDGQAINIILTPALPGGLAFDGTRLTGTPTTPATVVLTVAATDPDGALASAPLTLTLAKGPAFQTPEGLLTSFGQVGLFSTSLLVTDPAGR